MASDRRTTEHYVAQYRNFDSEVAAVVRREAYVDDIGQTGWLTTQEQDTFLGWLGLTPEARLLDVGCGAGGPTLRIARVTGCSVVGFDIDRDAIDRANSAAERQGTTAHFFVAAGESDALDAHRPFDAVMCIDAINHLADRVAVLRSWWRRLRPGGRLLFTDPVVITGPVSNEELGVRTSTGHFVLVGPGTNERLLNQAGFRLLRAEDHTGSVAHNARGRLHARARHEPELRALEGDVAFAAQQVFYDMAARLAEDHRLARIA